jgi:L-iditol 2-dehydrogenase
VSGVRRQATITRAAVWRGDGELVLADWELPPLGEDDLLVKVSACGVCGSDLHVLDGGFPGIQPPLVLGHESFGTVAALGTAVSGITEGDVVTWEPKYTCRQCFYCREGEDANLCENLSRISGSFADYTLVPQRAVHLCPAGCDPNALMLAEPLSCALYAFDRAAVRVDESVAIVGAGTIGLLLLMLARRAGARRVIVSDPNPTKRDLALQLGADEVLDPRTVSIGEAVRACTARRGADAAFEAVGLSDTVTDTMDAVRAGGRVALVGVMRAEDAATLNLPSLQQRDLTILACWVRRHTFQRAVQLLSVLPVTDLVTHHVSLDHVSDALRLLREGEGVKVAVVP